MARRDGGLGGHGQELTRQNFLADVQQEGAVNAAGKGQESFAHGLQDLLQLPVLAL